MPPKQVRSARYLGAFVFVAVVSPHCILQAQRDGGQAPSARRLSVRGTVSDPSGSAVPGVAITLKSRSTNEVKITVTDQNGVFRFDATGAGSYFLNCAPAGFTVVSKEIRVSSTSEPVRIILVPEPVKQSVTVAATPDDYRVVAAPSRLRVDTPVLEIPHSVQVVNHAVLEDRQVTRIADAAEQ
jgi:iron complex outermembrane receptor protein